jgi:hypothetical protein
MARLGAYADYRNVKYLLFLVAVVDAETTSTVGFLRVSALDRLLRLSFPSLDWFRGCRCRWNVCWFKQVNIK